MSEGCQGARWYVPMLNRVEKHLCYLKEYFPHSQRKEQKNEIFMHKERKTAKETFVLIKTGFPFPEREFAVEKHFFKTGLTFLSVLTNISFLNIAFGTV